MIEPRPKSAKPDESDRKAAAKLRKLWDQRLAEAKRAGERWTQESAGAAMGMTQGAISQYLNGRVRLGYGAVLKFAKFLGVAPVDIRADLDSLPDETADSDWPDIMAYRQAASLGDGAEPDEYAETHRLKFRAESLARKRLRADRLGVVYGKGDSMLPRIRSGDAILFDRSDTEPRDGALFVVSYGNELMAKRLIELGGRWFIDSLNKDDPKWAKPQPIDEHRGFKIHGRVRWIGSWED